MSRAHSPKYRDSQHKGEVMRAKFDAENEEALALANLASRRFDDIAVEHRIGPNLREKETMIKKALDRRADDRADQLSEEAWDRTTFKPKEIGGTGVGHVVSVEFVDTPPVDITVEVTQPMILPEPVASNAA